MDRAADAFAGIWRYAIHFHRRARHRTVGLNAAWRPRDKAAQPDFRFRRDTDQSRFAAGNEFEYLAECARVKRGLAVVDRAKHEIGRALQRRTIRGDPGRRARLADETAIGLGIFVEAVAPKSEQHGVRRPFAFAL